MKSHRAGALRSSLLIGSVLAGTIISAALVSVNSNAAGVVPPAVQMPGTQPGEVSDPASASACDFCHGGYDPDVEPDHNWRGSMMANAARDPIFWAMVAITEQDFDGAGDLCIRCHSTTGWYGGRSTPTDGSGLVASDTEGVDCEFCHKLTNPDDSEHIGAQAAPFVANDGGSPPTAYYGSGMASLWAGNENVGPYDNTPAVHTMQSQFHRSADLCGTCHDVSNPVVGDLAHNNGTQESADGVVSSDSLASPVGEKAAFNNFPYQYGIVERTFSEYKSGLLSQTLVSEYMTLPPDLRGGAIRTAYESAIVAGPEGNYADGTPRYFTCQTCHLPPVLGAGGVSHGHTPTRSDLPLHDMTGGNYWMPDVIQYLDAQDKLRMGGGLTATQIAALNDGKTRAMQQLSEAASLQVNGDTLKVINQTGHKLISGYPEGRRMWLNVKWYDGAGGLLREDGEYGPMTVDIGGTQVAVYTLLNLEDPNAKVYEAHYGLTQEWANQLMGLEYAADMPLSYDRVTGSVDYTLGQLAAQAPGTYHESFRFVLNNYVAQDNRIPPYGMSYDEARVRNTLPVPADQYGNPGPGGTYNYWDEVSLNPPGGAAYATIDLLYQPTSWEYIQFLDLANDGQNDFLANEGAYLLEAWLSTGMAAPYVMTSTTWGSAPDGTPSPSPSPTCTPTATPTGTCEDWDGDTLCDDVDPDDDNDGCSDVQELGPDPESGGMRDPNSFWDFFDADRNGSVSSLDVFAVLSRFNAAWDQPLTKGEALAQAQQPPPPAPAYHASHDRTSPAPGGDPWDTGPPDGAIAAPDIFAVLAQFNHSCE